MMAAIDRLLLPFPALGSERAEELLRLYVGAARDHDIRDVEAGVERLMTGRHPGYDGRFAATPPQMGGAILRAMDERLDRERRQRLAQPRLPPPDIKKDRASRERVLAATVDVAERLDAISDDGEAMRRQRMKWQFEKVNERFKPDMNPWETQKRLTGQEAPFEVGDADGEVDAA